MRADRSDPGSRSGASICDANGRHIPVTHGKLGRKPQPAMPEPMSLKTFRGRLDALATRVRRMTPPLNNNPEAFHEERSEIAREIERLAAELR